MFSNSVQGGVDRWEKSDKIIISIIVLILAVCVFCRITSPSATAEDSTCMGGSNWDAVGSESGTEWQHHVEEDYYTPPEEELWTHYINGTGDTQTGPGYEGGGGDYNFSEANLNYSGKTAYSEMMVRYLEKYGGDDWFDPVNMYGPAHN